MLHVVLVLVLVHNSMSLMNTVYLEVVGVGGNVSSIIANYNNSNGNNINNNNGNAINTFFEGENKTIENDDVRHVVEPWVNPS